MAPAAPPLTMVGPAESVIRPPSKPLDLAVRPLPSQTQRDWLQADVTMFWRLRSILPPNPVAASFFQSVHAPGPVEDTDLGFGYKRHRAGLGGGYASCSISATANAGMLLSMRVECMSRLERDTSAVVRPILEEALGKAFTIDTTSIPGSLVARVDYDFPSAKAAARAKLDRELAPLEPLASVATSPEISRAYEMLMSPHEQLAVGQSCGYAGTSPPGRDATLLLHAAGRVDLLRNVLRGPNPEARVYAVRALKSLNAMGPADTAIARKLESMSTLIETCSGCTFFHEPSAKVFTAKSNMP